MKVTEKQLKLINKIISFFGYETIKNYAKLYFDLSELDNLTKIDAQKIIIEYYPKLPKAYTKNVFGREFNVAFNFKKDKLIK